MFKRLLLIFTILLAPVLPVASHAAEMVNVEYIHKLIERDWKIKLPYNPKLKNPKVAANMKYLLTAVDVANEKLNGEKTTDYGNGKFATMYAADTVATNKAVATLVKVKPKFTITTTPDTTNFKFTMSAKGTFYVDWGDGVIEPIVRDNTTLTTYSHTYSAPKADGYKIGFAGRATGYSTDTSTKAISFYSSYKGTQANLAAIDGSLGAIFGTIGDGSSDGQQPQFGMTFFNCTNLTGSIPENLFAGISGAPAQYMFSDTFRGCSGLTGSIPANLFAGLSGAPAQYMFAYTFRGCSGLSGSIPENLFAGISGAPAQYMFSDTFRDCSGLTGSIPENLFAGLSGAPAQYMFYRTFFGCSGLTGSIPENLFSSISGAPAYFMFSDTFRDCSGLSGSIPENLFAGISGKPASSMFNGTFDGCSGLTGEIPADLFAGISGAPAHSMFAYTFRGCSGLSGSIPENLFAETKGTSATSMFLYTFANCTGLLTNCDDTGDLFAGITDQNLYAIINSDDPFFGSAVTPGACPYDGTIEPKFTITTTANTKTFGFILSAKGTFYVDWGDGRVDKIVRTNTTAVKYSHGYTTAGTYTIGFAGAATGYSKDAIAVISFRNNKNLATISGSLGAIFGTIGDGSSDGQQPRFRTTFFNCTNLTGSIPKNLFAGISGAPATYMFGQTFYGCSGLTGSIPENLFAGIKGTSASWMFQDTFGGCSGLSGCVPYDLFAGITNMDFNAIIRNYSPFANSGVSQEQCAPSYKFTITTTPDTTEFTFSMSAQGDYTIDWGDGTVESLNRNSATVSSHTHPYATAGEYTIKFYGTPARYSSGTTAAVISFAENLNVAGFGGSLGALFPTLGDGGTADQQPKFYRVFDGCTNLKGTIPENLFTGVHGAPVPNMFRAIFRGCTGLTGSIPTGLFADVSGDVSEFMFQATFSGCSNLSGSIPANLFSKITGQPQKQMFGATFNGCTGLTGEIPNKLFAGISGAPAEKMFANTFRSCRQLTSIPDDLFGAISGDAQDGMFVNTFIGCTRITTASAKIGDQYLYQVWPNATIEQVGECYKNATKLTDYSAIPDVWK